MTSVDLKLTSRLARNTWSFDDGAAQFLDWLRTLRVVPTFDVTWATQLERDGPLIPLEPGTAAYFAYFQPDGADMADEHILGHMVLASEGSAARLFTAELEWGGTRPQWATIDVYRADPRHGTAPAQYVEMIRITTLWQRPQHLDFSPTLYRMFDHPLDRTRSGIGWMGWLPFLLTPADVPEAAVVMPMNNGTFIQSVPDFWQAPHLPRQPDAVRDEATIARVQDVEIRLNLLGVLPTAEDLADGNWGR
jgi:hypothetical protein